MSLNVGGITSLIVEGAGRGICMLRSGLHMAQMIILDNLRLDIYLILLKHSKITINFKIVYGYYKKLNS